VLAPDAWDRFKRAVQIVAKSPPQHRTKKAASKKKSRAIPKVNPELPKGARKLPRAGNAASPPLGGALYPSQRHA
jgi:hypothetical protein